MINEEPSRLDRIEAILAAISSNLEEVSSKQVEFNNRIDSNAKAIEALTNERREAEKRLDRDRARLYQSMADLSNAMAQLASAQAGLASEQAGFYGRLAAQDELIQTLARRQGEIVEILKALRERGENR